jgi:hypothetical protein
MARWTLRNFLTDLGMRLAAASVVAGTFLGLGYLARTNLFGAAALLDDRVAFFTVAFLSLGGLGLASIAVQQYRT